MLLADDDEGLRSALTLLLETRLDVRVVAEASTMEAVLGVARVAQPDVILLDWELPGAPQQDRIAALRRIVPRVRVIVASARPEAAAQASAAQADAFVNKTDPPEIILSVVGQ